MYMYDFGDRDPFWSSTNEIEDLEPIFNCIKKRSVPLYDKIKKLYEHSDSMSSFKEKMILIAQMSIKKRLLDPSIPRYYFWEEYCQCAQKTSLFLKEFLETHPCSMSSRNAKRIVEELRKSF